jgi:hypothetical protein
VKAPSAGRALLVAYTDSGGKSQLLVVPAKG